MKTKLAILVAILSLGVSAFAHRLDEYLQAIIISIRPDQIQASMRLIPGVAVAPGVIAMVDANGDKVLAEMEQEAYARKVIHDLTLRVDDHLVKPWLQAVRFPTTDEMKKGLGEIEIEFTANLPAGNSHRTLVIENHHETRISVYLMNSLVPQESHMHITSQIRNQTQSYYRVDYLQSGDQQDSWLTHLVSVLGPFGSVPSMFRLGLRHIAEGTDHLLFLLVLLLPAPLVAFQFRWATFASVRHSLRQIVRVVTAFTVGHSLTLVLGASGFIHLASRPVEVLIAVSILVSAVHALKPLFPGHEPFIAAGFGLVHGLAFAMTLQNLGINAWQRVASILGFNLGIETMQLIIVAAVLPSFIMLSRTAAYTIFRLTGALLAGFVSLAWIMERLSNINFSVDLVLDRIDQYGVWLAVTLFVISFLVLLQYSTQPKRGMVTEQAPKPESF